MVDKTHHLNVASCASNRWLPCDPSLLTTCSKSKRLWFRPGNFSRLSRWAVHPTRHDDRPVPFGKQTSPPTFGPLKKKHAPQVCFTHMCDEYIPSIYTRNPAKKSEKCSLFIPNNYNFASDLLWGWLYILRDPFKGWKCGFQGLGIFNGQELNHLVQGRPRHQL